MVKQFGEGFRYLLRNHSEVFAIGQGLWSPWYVGSSMKDLDKEFGDRIIDTPVSEAACTGAAIGASLCGSRPIVIHPRMDFMVLATDPIVNQAAKWSHMLGGHGRAKVTIRGIINRGGQQGAQHSQALHSWYSHVPGLRVVMPYSAKDARDLLIAATLCDDPVLYIDDRWLYDLEDDFEEAKDIRLEDLGPQIIRSGKDITLVGCGFATRQCMEVANDLSEKGVEATVIDLRVLNPFDSTLVVESVKETGSLAVIDGSWKTCGFAGEVIASVTENVSPSVLKISPARFTLPHAPAPTAKPLEEAYYQNTKEISAELYNKLAVFKNRGINDKKVL